MKVATAICRALVGLIIVAAASRAPLFAADPIVGPAATKETADSELQYHFSAGQQLVYDVTIQADLPGSLQTNNGQLTYNVKAVDADGSATVTCSGNLASRDVPKHPERFEPPLMPRLSPRGGLFRSADVPEIVVDRHGNLMKFNQAAADTQLPFLLGRAIQLVIPLLPTDEKAPATADRPVAVYEKRDAPIFFTAKETATLTLQQPTAEAAMIHRRLQLATNAKSGDAPYLEQDGVAQVTFDRRAGMVRRIAGKTTIKINQENTIVSAVVTMSVRLMDAAELEKLAAARKAEEAAARARQIEEAKPKLLDDATITSLLADMASSDGFKVNGACDKLAKSALADSRQAEVEAALDRVLARGSQNFGPTKDAARALRVWGTSKSVPALAAAVADKDIFTRAEVLRTLAKFPDPRGAEAIAGVFYVGFGRDVAIQSLTQMGEMAEPYVIPLLQDRDEGVRKDAAELLGKIGTEKSLAPLEALAAKETGWNKDAAAKAITAIKERKPK